MARMHTSKKGKSSSKKPLRSDAKKWLKLSKEEVEKLVVKLAKKDYKPAQVGIVLRDVYGIPSVKEATGKTVNQIFKENKISKQVPYDLLALLKRAVNVREHLSKNKNDTHSRRGLTLIESKIRRLTKYYIRNGELPSDWRYNPETAKILIE